MYPGQTHSPKTPWTPLPWDSAGFLKIPWTPGTLWTPRLHRLPDSWTPLFLSLHGLSDSMDSQDSLDSQGIPPEDFSGLQRAGANRSSDSPMHRRLFWPTRTPSGHSFPSAALPPLQESQRLCRLRVGRKPAAYGRPLALGPERGLIPAQPGPVPERFKGFKSALTEISFYYCGKGGAQDAKLY